MHKEPVLPVPAAGPPSRGAGGKLDTGRNGKTRGEKRRKAEMREAIPPVFHAPEPRPSDAGAERERMAPH